MSLNRMQVDREGYRKAEALANAALNPGNIIEVMSTGKVKKHAIEGGFAQMAVAVEDALQGKTVDDAYASGALVQYHIVQRGVRFQGILKSGESVSIGTALISDGDGRLIALASAASATDVKQILCYAEEASDQSGSDGADTLIVVSAA